jgi:4'-phosphopantetheinyl transferase
MTENKDLSSQSWTTQNPSALHPQPLTGSDLHIWRATLSGSPSELAHYTSLLSSTEIARAERFYFERDHNRYIFGRGILRTLLGNYLGIKPSEVNIVYGEYGKPVVQSKAENKSLEFNLSHSNEYAVYVFGWKRAVGIDIEHIRPMPDVDDLAERFFSHHETELLKSLTEKKKWEAFFKLWTSKEALLKATGKGLTVPLNEAEISLGNDGSAQLQSIGGDTEAARGWRLEIFKPFADYQAAIIVNGHPGQLIFQQFDHPMI